MKHERVLINLQFELELIKIFLRTTTAADKNLYIPLYKYL